MDKLSKDELALQVKELQLQLAEAQQLIDAIKAGEVDAFAFNKNNQHEVFTLQSGDYAYRVLVENFHEGALNLSEEGLIVYTNTYFSQFLALPYEKVIGVAFAEFVHPSSHATFNELFKKGLAGQSKGEINLVSGNMIYPVYVSLTSLYPTLPTVGMIITDLTEKKEYERKMEEKNAELQRINKELEAFTYVSSHDLQEPLRKIQLFAGRIIDTEKENLSTTAHDYFERMSTAASRMQTLIQDLLNFSRITTSEKIFQDTDLRDIISDVKLDYSEAVDDNELIIETGKLCRANIIPFQFKQLMQNLISNAVRFAKPGVPAQIKIEATNDNDGGYEKNGSSGKLCRITVSDNGIGFEQRFSDKIFDVFQRLHSHQEYPGTGIGLAIVKKIVENHNGVITAKGELNKGATFIISIPA
ncbi:MAG TPA: ATP-binding protein [Ferruginibacter sp.]|nr:ATP-binding protein [Ferruginibacter sp.]